MSKRWRMEDDEFLVCYFDAMGDFIGEHDLGRPKGAATRRVNVLRKTGAFDAIARRFEAKNRGNIAAYRAELEYAIALGFDVTIAPITDAEATCPVDLWDGRPVWRKDPYGEDEEERQAAEMMLHQDMVSALREASQQIRFLHEKFQPTDAGEAVLARLANVLGEAAQS
jgi:hypothetical protein